MKLFLAITVSTLTFITLSSCTTEPKTGTSELINPVLSDSKYPDAYPVAGEKYKVISPYRPHNVINVKGTKPGHLVRDISTAKKGADGKPNLSTAKIFRLPMPAASAE